MTDLRSVETHPVASAGQEAAEVLEWRYDPWREHRGRALGSAIVAMALATVVVAVHLQPLTSLVLAMAAVIALSPGYASCRCRIDADGVHRRLGPLWWDDRPWAAIRWARLGRHALVVAPSARDGGLAAWRRLALPVPGVADREDARLRSEIARRIEAHGL